MNENAWQPVNAVLLRGGGTLQVVGESFHQEELERIVGGKREESAELYTVAVIRREPDNPADPQALAVEIDAQIVGHIGRQDALAWRPLIEQIENAGAVALCAAQIRGGWRRSSGEEGHFGVVLFVGPPEQALPRSSQGQKRGLIDRILGS